MHKVKTQKQRPIKSKLRQLRRAEGMTLVGLAKALGLHYTGLSRLERFEIQSLNSALKIVEFFGRQKISVEDILIPPKDIRAEQDAV